MLRRLVLLAALLLVPVGVGAQQLTRLAPPTGPVVSGTKTCGSAGAAIVASATTAVAVILRNASATENILLGGSAAQALTLVPGVLVGFDVSDLAQVYCKRAGSVDATLEYFAIKGP